MAEYVPPPPAKARYWIEITVEGKRAIILEVEAQDWGRADVYEAVLKPQIDEWAAYPGRDRVERAAVKRAVEHFCKQWIETPPEGAPAKHVEATYETDVWGGRAYGNIPDSEIPSCFPTPGKGHPDYEKIVEIESQLWPIPESVGTINSEQGYTEGKEGEQCLWGRPELIAALWRWQREILYFPGTKPAPIAINSAYRRLGTPCPGGPYGDPDGSIDRYDKTGPGHWTGYAIDVSRLITARRFGLKGEYKKEAVAMAGETSGLVRLAYRWVWSDILQERKRELELHHFRVKDEYIFPE